MSGIGLCINYASLLQFPHLTFIIDMSIILNNLDPYEFLLLTHLPIGIAVQIIFESNRAATIGNTAIF